MSTYVEVARDILRDELVKAGKGNQETVFEHAYLLLTLAKGEATTLEDVHDAWAVIRMVNRPWHDDIVPFSELTEETADYDRPFVEAIHATARRLAGGGE